MFSDVRTSLGKTNHIYNEQTFDQIGYFLGTTKLLLETGPHFPVAQPLLEALDHELGEELVFYKELDQQTGFKELQIKQRSNRDVAKNLEVADDSCLTRYFEAKL